MGMRRPSESYSDARAWTRAESRMQTVSIYLSMTYATLLAETQGFEPWIGLYNPITV
jgi:hypothetical protein